MSACGGLTNRSYKPNPLRCRQTTDGIGATSQGHGPCHPLPPLMARPPGGGQNSAIRPSRSSGGRVEARHLTSPGPLLSFRHSDASSPPACGPTRGSNPTPPAGRFRTANVAPAGKPSTAQHQVRRTTASLLPTLRGTYPALRSGHSCTLSFAPGRGGGRPAPPPRRMRRLPPPAGFCRHFSF